MTKLPTISGKEAIKAFQKPGYQPTRRKGSHIRLYHKTDSKKKPITIPDHKLIGKGLLRKLIRDAEITVEEFCSLL
jgi:predicted RNA binding protein YcfA (HicA-like mRNA interferase family)